MSQSLHFSAAERRAVFSIAGLYGLRMLGLFMVLPVLALYVYDYKSATPMLLGVALGAYGLTQALLQIPLGLMSDRVGRKPVIIGGLVLFVMGSAIAALSDSIYGVIIGRALQGAGAIASTLMALVADVTKEENRTKAMATIGASIGGAFMVAMILGPIVSRMGGISAVFWATTVLGALGVAWALTVIKPTQVSAVNRESQAVPAMIKSALADSRLVKLDIGVLVLHLILTASFVAIPQILEQQLGVPRDSHWWVYLLLLGGSFVAMVPGIIVAERGGRMKTVFVSAILLAAVSLVGFSQWHVSLVVGLALLFGFFMAFNLLEATLPSLVSKTAPAGTRGTAMGVYSTSQFTGAFLGGILGGWILSNSTVESLFVVLALLAFGWWLLALTMETPRALMGVMLNYRDGGDYLVELQAIPGVEEVVIIPEERSAYAKIDKAEVDWSRLRNYMAP